MLKAVSMVILSVTLAACGGSGDAPPPPANNWDQMVWDQGNWQ